MDESHQQLNAAQTSAQLALLHRRFETTQTHFPDVAWQDIALALQQQTTALWSLAQMEASDGEPSVFAYDADKGLLWFGDAAAESPKVRRSLCYDEAALHARKQHPPQGSAMEQAAAMGVSLMNSEQYQVLQQLWPCDLKTSSWLATPDAIRRLGGALFGNRRYDTVFVYHNGADSYYAARGFRCVLSLKIDLISY
ncbi:DUF4256 domain-containing protein [Vitreoscilla massiliensis]|uniref:DUF4256 domain-containing protein n=1 Tax=Vitreoscilla massiliensis TaxID=1689272 RepID=A0ABY4E0S7_9NEIS|nr:DUF4256 domain-containing protein [Vitreoscilla massiliensis]UOO89411.1 DUF4256 domain-containing protein [Vitreoscilla massiliensis]